MAIKLTAVCVLFYAYVAVKSSHVNLLSLEEHKCLIFSKPSIVLEKSFWTPPHFFLRVY